METVAAVFPELAATTGLLHDQASGLAAQLDGRGILTAIVVEGLDAVLRLAQPDPEALLRLWVGEVEQDRLARPR
jgi:hypothetical protein